MGRALDLETGEEVVLPNSRIQEILDANPGRYRLLDNVGVVDEEGRTFVATPDSVDRAFEEPEFLPESGGARFARHREAELEEEYGSGVGSFVKAAGAGALRGATFGGSDWIAEQLGADTYGLEQLRLRRPGTSLVSELGGAIVPGILSGGTGLAGTAARLTPAGLVTRASARLAAPIARSGSTSARILAAVVEHGAEAGTFALGQGFTDIVLHNDPATIETLTAHIPSTVILGAATGGVLRAAGMGASRLLARKLAPAEEMTAGIRRVDDMVGTLAKREKDYARVAEARAVAQAAQLSKAQQRTIAKAASKEVRDAFYEVNQTRKLIAEEFGPKLELERLLQKSSVGSVRSLRKLDRYLSAAERLEHSVPGVKFAGKGLGEDLWEGIAEKLPGGLAKKIDDIDMARVADHFRMDPKKLRGLSPLSERLLKLHATVNFASKGNVTRVGSLVRRQLDGAAQALVQPVARGHKGATYRLLRHSARTGFGWMARQLADLPLLASVGAQHVTQMAAKAVKGMQKVGPRTMAAATASARSIGPRLDLDSVGSSDSYKNRRARMMEYREAARSPEALRRKVEETTLPVAILNPQAGAQLADSLLARIEWLAAQADAMMPDNPYEVLRKNKGQYPSKADVDKWTRMFRAAENPYTLIADMEAGRLTHEAVETVKTLHPIMFQNIQMGILGELPALREGLPYQQRLKLSIFFDVPVDRSQEPAFVSALQGVYEQKRQAQQGINSPSGARPDISDRQTKAQRLEAR